MLNLYVQCDWKYFVDCVMIGWKGSWTIRRTTVLMMSRSRSINQNFHSRTQHWVYVVLIFHHLINSSAKNTIDVVVWFELSIAGRTRRGMIEIHFDFNIKLFQYSWMLSTKIIWLEWVKLGGMVGWLDRNGVGKFKLCSIINLEYMKIFCLINC